MLSVAIADNPKPYRVLTLVTYLEGMFRVLSMSMLLWVLIAQAQGAFATPQADTLRVSVQVLNTQNEPLSAAVVTLHRENHRIVKTELTDEGGHAGFLLQYPGRYYAVVSFSGYRQDTIAPFSMQAVPRSFKVQLQPANPSLEAIMIRGNKPFIQLEPGKITITPDASPSNAGTTLMEMLEKMPGVTIDQQGTISLKGKSNVLVMMDGKPTYLGGADLVNLLSSLGSAQVDQVELMTQPPARYDASGNAGIINIKTKRQRLKGFNGNLSVSYGQGRYPKSNNSLALNYRNGKVNLWMNYGINYNKFYTDLYALRTYYDPNGNPIATLDQPTYFGGRFLNQTARAGIDYFAGPGTTLSLSFLGTANNRRSDNISQASWLDDNSQVDSSLTTNSSTHYTLENLGITLGLRHQFSPKQELSIDLDGLYYDIQNNQDFTHTYTSAIGQNSATSGDIPSTLKIVAAKADHSFQLSKSTALESGIKLSHINTDNRAIYQVNEGSGWQPDYGKTNQFQYRENIQALYTHIDHQWSKVTLAAGLRFEHTDYDAHQLGNPLRKDSLFSRRYGGLFPTAQLSWQADSLNSFTLSAGRRIDRPAFQRLNPFVFIINKYTYETGNPYFRPQYSWNLELSHQFRNILTTTLSYSLIKDYFSQLFLTDNSGILYYTQGNVGRVQIAGLSVSTNLSLFPWWTLSGQAVLNYKYLQGYVWNDFQSDIWEFNISANNQLVIGENYTAELSGFFTGPARNDLQESLLPTGQLNIGIARSLLKKKATLKFSVRDLLHTQTMSGNTTFRYAHEYFMIRRDSRVFTLAFQYRFGKPLKAVKRGSGAADEMQRVN